MQRAWALGAGPGAEALVIDIDSTICEVAGHDKHGAGFGYTKVLGYHPLLATRADTGEVLHARMRKVPRTPSVAPAGSSMSSSPGCGALVPGSPALGIAGDNASPDVIKSLNEKYGFDRPLVTRYYEWLRNAVTGDLGVSPRNGRPVLDRILERMPVTVELALVTAVIAGIVSVLLAVFSVSRLGRPADRFTEGVMSVVISVPSFVAALALSWLFSVQLGLFPVQGWVRLTESLWGNIKSAVLPVTSLAIAETAILQRAIRNDLAHTMDEAFITAARLKGIRPRRIYFVHALRPSMFSAVTLLGISIGRVIGGTLIVEKLFSLPGMGTLLLDAVQNRDLVTVQGVVAVMAVAYILVSLAVDFIYTLLDPSLRRVATR